MTSVMRPGPGVNPCCEQLAKDHEDSYMPYIQSNDCMVGHPPVGEKHQQNVWYIQWLRPSSGSTFCELALRASHPIRQCTWQTTWHHVDAMWLKHPHSPFSYDASESF